MREAVPFARCEGEETAEDERIARAAICKNYSNKGRAGQCLVRDGRGGDDVHDSL